VNVGEGIEVEVTEGEGVLDGGGDGRLGVELQPGRSIPERDNSTSQNRARLIIKFMGS